MIALIRNYRLSFLFYTLVLFGGLVLVLTIPKLELHLLLNSSHTPFQDTFFKTITWLGDGWIALIFSSIFLLVRFRYFLMLILSFSISGLFAQFLKRVVFSDSLRPAEFLEQMPGIDLVPGVGLYHTLSFPSGHTTTAFAFLLLAGLILKSRAATFMGIVLAWSVALSRVYLSQHFLCDILAGSFLGVISSLFFYWYFQTLKPDWLDLSILKLLPARKK
ncbi:phosphatase PAP2 family protein [Bacteroidota bacterium]